MAMFRLSNAQGPHSTGMRALLFGLFKSKYFDSCQSLELFFENAVTFAGTTREFLSVANRDMPACNVDQSRLLQNTQRDRHARPPRAQHLSDELVRDVDLIGFQAIANDHQPATEALLNSMHSVAQRTLRCLSRQHLKVLEQMLLK